jgi:CDP-diacylglycerol--serine O-phosphatidyltransferase
MIGFYNYTVVLTYLSLLSAGTGIIVSLAGDGHPYWGVFFLLLCGLFDAFDGKVARTKADRSELEMNYGIQIDSLSDIVAFGVLPACIGVALINTSEFFDKFFGSGSPKLVIFIKYALFAVLVLYILAALIRLAYFNVTEEERQRTEGGVRRAYTGLPVTSAALIFPTVMLFRYLLPFDISVVYIPVTILTGFAFLGKFSIPKPKLRGILIMVAIGLVEAAALLLIWYFRTR